MKRNTLKIAITMLTIVLFASCKTSSETKNNSNQKERSQGGQPSVEKLLTEMDSNKDGKLSKDEVKGPLAKDFSKIDTNEDGYLTTEELKKAPKPNRQGSPNGSAQRR